MSLKEKIIEAKNIFGEKAAHIIAKDLNIENWDSEKLKGCCPFHNEKTGSFVYNKDDNHFRCFGCGRNFGILDHWQTQGLNFIEAVKKLFEESNTYFSVDEYKKTNNKKDYFKAYRYPHAESNESRKNVEDYLHKRGLTNKTLDICNIKEDNHRNIVFEYRDEYNQLLCNKYRPAKAIKKGDPKMWWNKEYDNCPTLFNKQNIDITKPLIITEGEIDTLSIVEAGETNVVSIPYGSQDTNWIEFNWEWLENFNKIIIWADDDEPGIKMINECIPRLGKHRCYKIEADDIIKNKLLKASESKQIRDSKCDANNVLIACGKEDIIYLLQNPKEIPNKKLKFLMDCQEVDIQNIAKITSGYSNLDKIIYGSLMGCFTITTGYTGDGKSTFANQVSIISPIENGYNSMVFSGELSEGQLKNWVLKPLAGYNHIVEWVNEGKPNGYTVTEQAKKAIESHYKQNIILYDDQDTFDTSSESILSEMEYSYRRYGTKFFLIDNLMTIDFQNLEDKWESQKAFIKQILKFTIKYDVNCNLIVHPKKPSKEGTQNSYELHGGSEMANLCHRLNWVKRLYDDPEGYNTEIKIIKDRPTGMAGKSVKLYYDNRTMRLYSDEQEKNRIYSWENNYNIKYPDSIKPKLLYNITENKQSHPVFG